MFNPRKYFEKVTQDRSKVYIVPSKHGFRFVAINFFLFLIAITYANNLALLITFMMVTFFVLQMFSIHRIIQNLSFEKMNFHDDYINHEHSCRLLTKEGLNLDMTKHIELSLQTDNKEEIPGIFSKQNTSKSIEFSLYYSKRGVYQLKRVKFFTFGPTKLFYVWRYFPLNETVTVYPQRIKIDTNQQTIDQGERTNTGEAQFEFHERYNRGISSKRIDWKVYAKTDQLYAKKFTDQDSIVLDINFNSFQTDKEKALSHMSFLIDKYYHDNISYKLTLPNISLSPNHGPRHFQESMEAISGF